MPRKTSYFDQTCNKFISDWVVMACLGPKPIKVYLRTKFQDGIDKPQKCRNVCNHPTHQQQRRPSTLPSSRMPGSLNSSGARLAIKVQSSQCYKINNTTECHQYKPDTDVVKAAKKACTSYILYWNQCARAK
jgi:hypothetical protein